ncbi:hypothetical protein ACIP25_20500 [Streptomyces massasporeus]|uniref:hypothetical protein n=1 Tax=Streptomyces massasporeus TaxID=67324 RepID=UPI00380922CD
MASEPARDDHLDPGADTIGDHPDLDAIEELCSGSIPDAVLAARARETVPRLVAEVRRLRWLVEYGACPTAGTTGTEFVLPLDEEMLDYFREMVDVLVERLGVPRAEAPARVNAAYGTRQWVALDLQLMGHELPEYWAYGCTTAWTPGAHGCRLPHPSHAVGRGRTRPSHDGTMAGLVIE